MKILIPYSSKSVHKILLEGTENIIVLGDIPQRKSEKKMSVTQ